MGMDFVIHHLIKAFLVISIIYQLSVSVTRLNSASSVFPSEISSSHSSKYEDDNLLVCSTVYSLIQVDRHFSGAYCLHHQGDE
jgi:hypothetical protein